MHSLRKYSTGSLTILLWFATVAPCCVAQSTKEGLAAASSTAEWPQYRGPKGDGVSHETGWKLGSTARPLWEAELGAGSANVCIAGGRLFTISTDPQDSQRETVWCLDAATGKTVWKYEYTITSVERGHNPAGGTPTLVGKTLFAYGAAMNLHALDAATGKVLWSHDLMRELPGKPTSYGYQLSPICHGNLVIVPAISAPGGGGDGPRGIGRPPQAGVGMVRPQPGGFPPGRRPPFAPGGPPRGNPAGDGGGGGSLGREPGGGPYPSSGGILIAFDQKTGREVWRLAEGASAWSSPVIANIEDVPTLVHLTGQAALGVAPADGRLLWKFDPHAAGLPGEDMAASPVIVGNLVVAPFHKAHGSTRNGTAVTTCLRIKKGNPELVWTNTKWCHWFQSAVADDGYLYGYDESSTFYCFELESGRELWSSQEFGMTGRGGGALTLVSGTALAIDGRCNLVAAKVSASGFELLGKEQILQSSGGYQCNTAPVLVGGRLYCRNHSQLICFDVRGK